MADMRGLKRKLAEALDNARYRTTRRGVTGNGTSANPREGLLPGFVWVRLSDQRDAVAVRGTVNQVDVPVLVSRDIDGGYFIERIDTEPAVSAFGQSAFQALQPPLTQISSPIDASFIKAGRVRLSEAGGLWVRVEPFAYDNGYFVGGELLLVPTATVGKRAWVLVYLDPTTNTLHQQLGANTDLALTLLPSTIEDIAIPANAIPLGAVNLANGQTAIAGSDIQDARYHITKRRTLYYQTVQNDATPMTQRPTISFFGAGVTVTDDAINNRTRVQISGGGGSGGSKLIYTRTLLHEETLSANGSFDVSGISQDYEHLEIILYARSTVSSIVDNVHMYFNNDTTDTNYRHARHYGGAGHESSQFATPQVGWATAANSTANLFAYNVIEIPFYTGSKRKDTLSRTAMRLAATTSYMLDTAMNWENTNAINRIMLRTDNHPTNLFVTGTILQIFGIREESTGALTVSNANVSNPPTAAQLNAAFGTPASAGEGYQVFLDNNGAGTHFYHVVSDGTNWWYTAFTKAT